MNAPLNVSAGLDHQLLDTTRESSSRYREQDGQRWQAVFDKARVVEGGDTGDLCQPVVPPRLPDTVSLRDKSAEPTEATDKRAAAAQPPMTLRGQLLQPWTIPLAHKGDPLVAITGFALPLSGSEPRAATDQATTDAAEFPRHASHRPDWTNPATGAAPTGQAAVNITWVTGSLGQLQLYLRASHLSRGEALDLAWRLRPALPSSQGGPATLVLNGTVLYDHAPASGQGIVFTG